MGSKTFNFNDTVRRIPSKAISSDVLSQKNLAMIKIILTDPKYSGVAAYPYKYLPVMSHCDELTNGGLEGIVIPKGTIVSLVTNQTSITSGIPVPASSGTVPVYEDQIDTGWITAPIDDSYFGYEESITALLVPANGGSISAIPYSTLDDDLDSWSTSSDEDLSIGGNLPLGIVMEDIFQDSRGKNLNYQTHDAYSTVVGGRFDLPFVDTSIITDFGSDSDIADSGSGYASVWKEWAFLAFSSIASGALLKSDLYGKFVVEGTAVGSAPTVQTVGKLQTLDCRFPKELSATIQNYPGTTGLLGVNTGGIPTDLYMFAYTVLTAVGLTATATSIKNYVRDGAFGYARISLGI